MGSFPEGSYSAFLIFIIPPSLYHSMIREKAFIPRGVFATRAGKGVFPGAIYPRFGWFHAAFASHLHDQP